MTSEEKNQLILNLTQFCPNVNTWDAQYIAGICESWGFTLQDCLASGRIKDIEVTLDDLDTMHPIGFFTALRSLSLTHHKIRKLEGLENLVHLEQLWVCDNQIQQIEGLQNWTQLILLNLSTNQIKKIQGLDTLSELQQLWLCNNRIETLENLDKWTKLEILQIGQNRIEIICDALSNWQLLQEVNLAGNWIGSFRELLNITKLPSLNSLWISDPNFGENPIWSLQHYQTYILYYLGRLKTLDTYRLTEEAKLHAETTFMKKRMYYNMRIKTMQRAVSNLLKTLSTYSCDLSDKISGQVSRLSRLSKIVERELEERRRLPASRSQPGDLLVTYAGETRNPLDDRNQEELTRSLEISIQMYATEIGKKLAAVQKLQQLYSGISKKIQNVSEQNIHKLLTELETGGNIRYEEGKETDEWYQSCDQLIQARFIPEEFAQYGISKLRINKITRIHNRFVRNRFDENLNQVTDLTKNSYKKEIEFLFYPLNPTSPQDNFYTMEEGFRGVGSNEFISITNSLLLVDLERIKNWNSKPIPQGCILICRVYTGMTFQDPVYNAFHPGMSMTEAWEVFPNDSLPELGVFRTCVENQNQKIWFLSNGSLVLPEYMVDFEYVMTGDDESKIPCRQIELEDYPSTELTDVQKDIDDYWLDCKKTSEPALSEVILNRELEIPMRSTLDKINAKVVTYVARSSAFSYINYLNLGFNSIKYIEGLEHLENLQILILTNNEIENLTKIKKNKELISIDVSFNRIACIDNLGKNQKIQEIDISENIIEKMSTVEKLASECSVLRKLDLSRNPINRERWYRSMVLRQFVQLEVLDKQPVTEEEKEIIIKQGNSEITKDMVRKHAQATNKQLLTSIHYTLIQQSPVQTNSEDWEQQVDTLNLSHCHLTSLNGLEYLFNLRKAYFVDNEIQEISGLQNWRLLEELSLENNLLTQIEGINHLIYLKKLDLGKNQIRVIENLRNLEYLTQLSLEDNYIESVRGVLNLRNLMELYVANNLLSDKKDISVLRDLPKLIILDMSGNPLCSEFGTRQFIVWQWPRLKVLDGVNVEALEKTNAKARLSGRLTQEILDNRLQGQDTMEVTKLDLSKTKLKDSESIFNSDRFLKLAELNISDNELQSFRCFSSLPLLRKLRIDRNQIDTFHPRDVDVSLGLGGIPNLEVLDISHNQLTDLIGLQIFNLLSLVALRATNNSITKIDWLFNLTALRELDLRNNKIREIALGAFGAESKICYIRLDDNFLRSLSGVWRLEQLRLLNVSGNRLNEIFEVEKLMDLEHLEELSLKNNPVTRKQMYRSTILKRLPQLRILDEQEVQPKERVKPDIISFTEVSAPPLVHLSQQHISNKLPARLTAMQLDAMYHEKGRKSVKRRPSTQSTGPAGRRNFRNTWAGVRKISKPNNDR